ncbi:MAG: DNA polymerase III subunit gamma/tau [Clostridia bacterium]|nr:DNA polymerase III subunit gamma/tau [Clostridia bacterium]
MAYLALYRAFRPTSLNDVVRQEHIVTVLKNQIATGRVGHAYLFCGPRGTGKTSIAKIFAMSINCENPVDGSPCGKCFACRALSDPANLDISEIDAASNNGVDEMRDLREKVQYPPVAGKYKVYIIDEVHMLSPGAFNALLKTLEEPPAHAVFILATTESAKIPATILSRCMRFDFKLIPQADLEERLRYVFDSIGKKYESEAISAIARAGAGSVRDMLSIADTCVSYASGTLTYADVTTVLGGADFSGVAAFCEAVLCGNAGEAFERAEAFLAAGKSVGVLVKDVMNFLNSCAVAKICRDGKNILALPDSNYAEVLRVAKAADGHGLLRASEIFAEVEQTLKYSASPRILFETAVLKASMPKNDYDIEALLTRIAALEKRLEDGAIVQAATTPVEKEPEPTVAAKPVERVIEKPLVKESVAPEMEAPPDEEETGGNVYFDEGFLPQKKTVEKPTVATTSTPTVKTGVKGDAKSVFGTFLRSLRKTGKSGVLFAICMDLEYAYEGDTFTFYTDSETIYNSLVKPEHYPIIKASFEGIGVAESGFAIKLRGKAADTFNRDLDALKQTFNGVKIDVK